MPYRPHRKTAKPIPLPRPSEQAGRNGFPPVTFDIPAEWWSSTDTLQTERKRAERRAMVKEYARHVWGKAIREGKAWHVRRYVAVIGVAYPRRKGVFPARAAETVKPIIDVGTEYRLWDDDDANHRCATIYFQLPKPAPAGRYRLTVYIFPVPTGWTAGRNLGGQIIQASTGTPTAFSLQLHIPYRLWVTSNITDSDLKARQHGAKRSSTWGGWDAFGVRQHVVDQLIDTAAAQWERTPETPLHGPFIVFAGVRYAIKGDADPDNAAETVNALMRAGVQAGRLPGVTSDQCKATVFFRLKGYAEPTMHDVKLYVLPLPEGRQWLDLLIDSCEAAWKETVR